MIVKVCGLREPENISQISASGADWLGFIFWKGSKRYAGAMERIPELREGQKKVGVFVNEKIIRIVELALKFGLDIIQLHADEAPRYIEKLRLALMEANHPSKIIKAVSIAERSDIHKADSYAPLADYLLFDTACKGKGGSGMQFDWELLKLYTAPTPFLLSGGIAPSDTTRLRSLRYPQLLGFDINSRFELSPGVKDSIAVRKFITELKNYE